MQILQGQWVFSAHDLISVLECKHRLILNKLMLEKKLERPDVPIDANKELIKKLGFRHEEKVRELLESQNASFVKIPEITKNKERIEEYRRLSQLTLEAMNNEAEVIFQGVLFHEDFFGYVDFLLLEKDESGAIKRDEKGQATYSPVDTKLARKAKKSAVIQIGAYAEVLGLLGRPVPEFAYIWLGNDEKIEYRTDEITPLIRELFANARQLISDTQEIPHPIWAERKMACDQCDWINFCQKGRELDDDISLIYDTRVETRKKLRKSQFGTVALLAKADAKSRPTGIAPQTFNKLLLQAKIQDRNRNNQTGIPVHELIEAPELHLLPKRSQGDIWFDMEGDPHALGGRGLEYLFGAVYLEGSNLEFKTFGASDAAGEKKAFADFMDWVFKRLQDYPDMHIYHYADYENRTIKRLAQQYMTRMEQVNELLARGVLVDLFKVIRKSFRFSSSSLSLKEIEKIYGAKHQGDVATAADSIVQYEHYLDLINEEKIDEANKVLKAIYDYNQDDCESTKQLDDWLRQEAHKLSIEIGQIGEVKHGRFAESVKAESIDNEKSDHEQLIEDLNIELERLREQNADSQNILGLEILIGSLGFHLREKQPIWWQHFERVKAEESELVEDTGIVFSNTVKSTEWEIPDRKRTYSRRIYFEDTRLNLEDVFSLNEDVFLLYDGPGPESGLSVVDSPRVVTKGKTHQDFSGNWYVEEKTKTGVFGWQYLPIAALPGPPVNTSSLTKVLMGLGREVLDNLERDKTLFTQSAWSDIAMRSTPKFIGLDNPPRNHEHIKNVIDAVTKSGNSYVAVQGPPGSGKSYVGTHVVKELIQLGYKIGIVAQSHVVIENFLDKLYELDNEIAIAKEQKHDLENIRPWNTAKIEVFAGLQEGGYAIGGTAWSFSRPLVRELDLDLMVIEEAGQFSLANTLVVGSAAKKVLLLGDPQQLGQVSQASHEYPVDISALSHILGNDKTISDSYGYFLEKTYRMHPDIAKKVSVLQYENRLVADPVTTERKLAGVNPGVIPIEMNHSGNTTRSDEEVEKVLEIINDLVGKQWTNQLGEESNLIQEQILVVAPFNNQVRALKQKLKKVGFEKVKVGTVDKFQGQEAPVTIISMTTSSGEDLPRGIEFLLEPNRLNVAISRAQWTSYLIYSKELRNINPSSIEGLKRLGGFIGLIEKA